mmetsp:Transcript_47448/g.75003  ORF Transcript_47448/g.75003 Transcript_47448/m.75003 type:complete len:549 (-) Transcript_47448:90-1736(-)|eukprot:CAMPEP_0169236550 /NCGR_PEP_ID=MMETSP1016-20121227/29326_1 /TAXON_ID=342587 /ORGANISM="Karlodinium micrum, Strain CCMP2283" /LENGTH=548 /DNA_ID=CAMNT_0009316201 /DNA_START=8 /DNA_END=1654 /DNA_ORIENTATION=-
MCEPPAVGTRVEVQGLKNRADLNGKRGWVTGHDAGGERIEVTFEGPTNEKVKIKPVNISSVGKSQGAGDGLVVGACVEISGLQSRPDLNGRRGFITSRDDVAGRIEVELDGLGGNERIKVKLSNIKLAKDGLAVGVQVEVLELQNRPDLNGRRGVIVGREIAADILGNDRFEVHLDGPNGGERVKCKPTNLRLVAKQPDLSAAVEIAAAAARLKAQRNGQGCEPHSRQQPASKWDQSRPSSDNGRASSDQRQEYPMDPNRNFDRDSLTQSRNLIKDSIQQMNQSRSCQNGAWPDADRDYMDRGRNVDRGRESYRERERSRSRPRHITRIGVDSVPTRSGTVEDRSRDWVCRCGERNFLKRANCFRCGAARQVDAPSFKGVTQMMEQQMAKEQREWASFKRTSGPISDWVPAKGLLEQEDWDNLRKKVDARRSSRKSKHCRRDSSSSSSSESSSSSGKKRRGKSTSPERSFDQMASSVAEANTELDKLKNEALQKLLKIRDEPIETRKRSWRGLLLEWHPDKHPDQKENVTAVFQFLQKGKALLDLKGA